MQKQSQLDDGQFWDRVREVGRKWGLKEKLTWRKTAGTQSQWQSLYTNDIEWDGRQCQLGNFEAG